MSTRRHHAAQLHRRGVAGDRYALSRRQSRTLDREVGRVDYPPTFSAAGLQPLPGVPHGWTGVRKQRPRLRPGRLFRVGPSWQAHIIGAILRTC